MNVQLSLRVLTQALLVLLVGASAAAQPAPAETTPTASAAAAAGASAQQGEQAASPHGNMGAASGPSPHGDMGAPRGPTSADSPELPPGTLQVLLVDPSGQPVMGQQVNLEILKSSIAEGDSSTHKQGISDPLGTVTFSALPTTTDFSFSVTVEASPAKFMSGTFALRRNMGRREVLTLYPITRDQTQAQVVGRGVIAVHPRDDVFVIDVLYQLINIGKVAWVPEGLVLRLPEGWKAFTAQESATDTRFEEAAEVGAKLLGTFPPGSQEVGFRFQLPNPHQASFSTKLPLFPRTIEMRVIVDAASSMTLEVPGYGESFPDRMRSGQRVLVAQKSYLERRERSPDSLSVTIGGMRTKGNGHLVALALALCIVGYALWHAWQAPRQRKGPSEVVAVDLQQAQELLLGELVALEGIYRDKGIGTKAYDQTRRALLTSLARLQAPS